MRYMKRINSGFESQIFGASLCQKTATATIAYGGLLFPRGERGPPLRLRKVEAVSDYPTSRLNASDEKLGLDSISSTKLASIPIADSINSRCPSSRSRITLESA